MVDGRIAGTPIESALVALARKSCEAPARLEPADLEPIRGLVGDGALDYVLVLASFHFINRIADQLGVDPEVAGLGWLRRMEPIRRQIVGVTSRLLRRMDLTNRPYGRSFDDALALLPASVDRRALEPLRPRPHLVEAIALAIEERDRRSRLERSTLARVYRAVEASLPACADDAGGFHVRPPDPVLAFAFVGTRYAQRTTEAMIEDLRAADFDDVDLLDLAIAVADANQWARMHRLLGLPPGIFGPSQS